MAEFDVELNVDNIGPHSEGNAIKLKEKVTSNEALFYALNGTGKTFISRMFRLAELGLDIDTDHLLTIKKNSGSMYFKVDDRELNIRLKRGCTPEIINSTDYLFHVFNSDFVDENVRANDYEPDGNIDGYILGKVQIDLSVEKEKEQELIEKKEELNKHIESIISESRKELIENKVQTNINELKLLSRNNIDNYQPQDLKESYETIENHLKKLADAPETIDDINSPRLDIYDSALEEAIKYLKTSYPKSEWDDDFISELKKKRSFIEEGLELDQGDERCPFCGRTYDDYSLHLVKQYRQYLEDKEAQIIKEIDDCSTSIGKILSSIEIFINKTEKSRSDYLGFKHYFPSLDSTTIETIVLPPDLINGIDTIQKLLQKKTDNLSRSIAIEPEIIKSIRDHLTDLRVFEKNNNQTIQIINKTKNNVSKERLNLRRDLCKAQYEKCYELCKKDLNDLISLEGEISKLQKSIREKELKSKTSKKEIVTETLTKLLSLFFGNKYSFDTNTFKFRFHGETIDNKTSKILSDGEKSIVAFCLFIAYTHELLSTEDDYKRLFFIIDDPVSSMDFNYVFVLTHIIRDIDKIIKIEAHRRMWVFTHNYEFLNLLGRNNIINQVFYITPGSIKKTDYKKLLPYENHLKDIVDVSDGNKDPDYTTGNSIRHVLETIIRFENPQIGLLTYIQENDILSKDPSIYLMCNDLSHGGVRYETATDLEQMRKACSTIIEFIQNNYPHHLESVRGNNN